MALTLFGLVIACALIAPPKASAQVAIGIGIGVPHPAYGYVVGPGAYYAPRPYVAYAPGYDYPPYGPVFVGGGWHGRGYGYRHDGWRGEGYRHGYEGGRGYGGRGYRSDRAYYGGRR